MDFLVLRENRVMGEAFSADGAEVRPLPRVDFPVPDVAGLVRKALPAGGTLKGLLARVNPLVHHQNLPLPEALPALGAGEGPLPRVHPVVPVQLGGRVEGLLTIRASEGFRLPGAGTFLPLKGQSATAKGFPGLGPPEGLLPDVDFLVVEQLRLLGEALPALQAAQLLLFSVDPVVPGKDPADGEALPAPIARIGPLARVGPLVHNQGRFEAEALPAALAGEGLFARVGPLVRGQHGTPAEGLAADGTGLLPPDAVPFLDHRWAEVSLVSCQREDFDRGLT